MPSVAPKSLVVENLKIGSGAIAELGDSVTVQYVGVSCSTGKAFSATWGQGPPETFILKANSLIPGWVQGLPGMKVGGERELVIPPDLGYGDQPPAGSGILPGETLVFVVNLVAVG